MPVLKFIKKIPGGLMVIPLFLGVIFNTFFPASLEIGSFTTHLWKTGALPILAVFLFCNGAQINIKQAGKPILRGAVLQVSKFLIGAAIGIAVNAIWGPAGVLGLTPLALVAALTNNNGGLYAALAGEYGDSNDVGAVSVLTISDGPFLTMVAFGLTGIANIPLMMLAGAIIPIIAGCMLGNLDEELRAWLKPGTVLLIPFFAFPLGAQLNLGQLITSGAPGIILGVLCCITTGLGGYYALKLIRHKKPQVGAAIGTTAGNAAATPAALAATDPVSFSAFEAAATAQIAAAIIITAILCPIFVNFLNKSERNRNCDGNRSRRIKQ